MAGFEGADHVNGSGRPLDMVASAGHDRHLDADYASLARLGIRTARESIGWRLTERASNRPDARFDFTRSLQTAEVAGRHGVQVLWSLMHYGIPAGVSFLDDAFCERFADFAAAAARALRATSDATPVYTPINEINFLAWAVAESSLIHPHRADSPARLAATAHGRDLGFEVKCRLVRATLQAIEAIRAEDSRARFLHVEPIVHVVPPADAPWRTADAERVASWQWQAWDMLRGTLLPELGGSPAALDLIGVNYYHNCQWELDTGRRLEWHLRDLRRVPFSSLLQRAAVRYGKRVLVSETSHVGEGRAQWLAEIADEVSRARGDGVGVDGICLYPIVDRPDWEDEHHWHRSGLWDVAVDEPSAGALSRRLNPPYARSLRRAQRDPGLRVSSLPDSKDFSVPHIVVFSHLRWNFVFQRPQHLLSRLARRHPVVFIEEPVRRDEAAWLERTSPCAGVEVLRPHTPIDAFGFHDDQLSLLEPMIASWLDEQGIDDYVCWLYTPMALPLLQELRPRAVIYDCMDELSAFKGAPRQMKQRETALMKRAELVLTGGPGLYESKRPMHDNVLCLPSAVDARHYDATRARADEGAMARAQALQGAIPEPRLGFFGVIDERLDIELVAALADAEPQWQIVMVGPVVKIDPASLPQRPNLHWLGQQSYEILPQIVADWTVCLMPFAMNESTRFISPTKTLEYMAAGKPVVSTPIHDVLVMFGDLVVIGDDAPSFIAACRIAIAETPAEVADRQANMQERVAGFSWDRTADTIAAAIEAALATPGGSGQAGVAAISAGGVRVAA